MDAAAHDDAPAGAGINAAVTVHIGIHDAVGIDALAGIGVAVLHVFGEDAFVGPDVRFPLALDAPGDHQVFPGFQVAALHHTVDLHIAGGPQDGPLSLIHI